MRIPFDERNRLIPALKKAIVATFDDSDWKDVGYELDDPDLINGHPRLLRSLYWGDPDYDRCVYDILETIFGSDLDRASIFLENPKIKSWINQNDSKAYNQFYDGDIFIPDVQAVTLTSRGIVRTALADAEVLLERNGPVSAFDRVHTALHGFLLTHCDSIGIPYPQDASDLLP